MAQQAHQRIQVGKFQCVVCNEVINGTAVGEVDAYFHPQCFPPCWTCRQPIDHSVGFVHKDDHIHHPECYTQYEAPRCAACQQPMSGKFVKTPDGKEYHKECFVCNGCGCDLGGGFAMRDQVPYCGACINQVSAPVVTSTVKSVAHDGIRVDPRSGKVTSTAAPAAAAAAANTHKFCPNCGAKGTGTKFCTGCGTSLLK